MSVVPDTREVARRWFAEVWDGRRDDLIEVLMSPEASGVVEGGEVRGHAGFREMRNMFVTAFPDIRLEIEDIVAEGDRAAVRWRARGTHGGDAFGIAASQRPIDVRGTSWLVVRNGQIVRGWDTWNLDALLASLR